VASDTSSHITKFTYLDMFEEISIYQARFLQ